MNTQTQQIQKQEEWLEVLAQGMVVLPKKWRDELGIEPGDNIKAKKQGNRVVIEVQKDKLAPYRIYTDKEIDKFLQEDKLPAKFARKVKRDLSTRINS